MPKLLQINSVANIGSTGHIAEQIGEKVLAEGWESFIAYGRVARPSKSELIRIGNKFDTLEHALASRISDCQGLQSKNTTRKLINSIKSIAPDIVQLHNLHGHYINYPLLLEHLKTNRIPTVITLHDFWLMTGHCAYINDSCNKWKTGCESCPRLNSYPSSLLDRSKRNYNIKSELFENFSNVTLVPVSEWQNEIIKESMLKKVGTHTISNGIDINQFYYDNSPSRYIDGRFFNILCVATRWTDSNGFDDIIRLSKIIDSSTHILIVGVDKKQQKLLPSNITGILRTENINELRALYSQANLFVNPNREVTFGLVTAEAMACGTPAVVYRNTAGEEIVGDVGYVIDDITEVPAIVQRMRGNQQTKPKLDCVQRIRSRFNVSNTMDNYFNLYQSLLHYES